ncbi:MAG: hypothetical protein IJZ68_06285 [Bacteroidaceae bacterium]|nr:hypothetical protein [Bacteroidaceae bacterium]
MSKKIRIVGISAVAILWLVLTLVTWFKPAGEMSTSERRPLAQFPELSVKTVLSGDFTSKFEDYTLDQFPGRDTFRQLKSIFHYYVMQQSDNNDIYIEDGYAAKLEYPLNQDSLDYANKRFDNIYNKYLKNTDVNIYFSVIPDKSYYIGEENGYPVMDYQKLFSNIQENNEWAKYIDITGKLDIQDYYKTDTHWRQENILDVAQLLCEQMGVDKPTTDMFTKEKVEKPFYGVYYGQAALPMPSEEMYILNSDTLSGCIVTDFETNKKTVVYDKAMWENKDLYDYYLGGAKALLTIENPNATTDRELVIFRDSFGSSITPLFMESYAKVTLVDIRYINSDFVGNFVKFNNQDVLFLYSTLVLNSSSTLK